METMTTVVESANIAVKSMVKTNVLQMEIVVTGAIVRKTVTVTQDAPTVTSTSVSLVVTFHAGDQFVPLNVRVLTTSVHETFGVVKNVPPTLTVAGGVAIVILPMVSVYQP